MQISSTSYQNSLSNRFQPQLKTQAAESEATAASDNNAAQAATEQQLQKTQTLKNRDREVRNHEQAHLSAAGNIAVSGASFQFVTGPDGQRYAIAGEVSIDTAEVANDPAATLRKAETIRRAALAPAQPSSQDYSVASKAATMAQKAMSELLANKQDQQMKGQNIDTSA